MSGKAKPEIFAMGVRNDYTIHIDKKTDAITTAWIGPDQGAENLTWGPAKTENATMMNKAGNWGWPFCQAGNRWDYRLKAAGSATNGGTAVDLPTDGSTIPGAVGGGVDGQTGAFFDCRGTVINDSPYNYGLQDAPRAEPGEHLVRPAGRLLLLPEERQRRRDLHHLQHDGQHHGDHERDLPPVPVDDRRQPGADRRRHLPQADG